MIDDMKSAGHRTADLVLRTPKTRLVIWVLGWPVGFCLFGVGARS